MYPSVCLFLFLHFCELNVLISTATFVVCCTLVDICHMLYTITVVIFTTVLGCLTELWRVLGSAIITIKKQQRHKYHFITFNVQNSLLADVVF